MMTSLKATACSKCGAEIQAEARFCSQCGAEIVAATAAPELRELTVMFCDLVGATRLADTLDPEDLRELTVAYQHAAEGAIAQEAGHVAQYLGDGLLVYFGYPNAHEDDPYRAVRAALRILAAMKPLNESLERDRGIQLHVRIGIHTGEVVIGEIGGSNRRESLALGRAPNVAARIQALADVDSILVSNDTLRLVEGFFECEFAGEHELKGINTAIRVHRVMRVSAARSSLEARRLMGLTRFTGREHEFGQLEKIWQSVADASQGHTVLLNGEPGIGKSRIVAQFGEAITGASGQLIECACAIDSKNQTLQPIIGAVETALRFNRDISNDKKWSALGGLLESFEIRTDDTHYLLGRLLDIDAPAGFEPREMSPQKRRHKTLQAITSLLLSICGAGPVLFVVEDIQWADPTTLELLSSLAGIARQTRLMILLTFRSDFVPPLAAGDDVSGISLGRLATGDARAMLSHIVDERELPGDMVEQLIDRSEGVPLYIEEITKSVLDSGTLVAAPARDDPAHAMTSGAIPPALRISLLARLDRLGDAKKLAQLAASIGREFRLDVLRAVANFAGEDLNTALAALVEAELIYPVPNAPDPAYIFKHALIRDTAYQSMLKRSRRRQHARIAQTYVDSFPDIAERRPEMIAQHFATGGNPEEAAVKWLAAGRRALDLGANYEVIAHINAALEQLNLRPHSHQRDEVEIDCYLTLTPALQMAKGWAAPEVDQAFKRSAELLESAPDTPHRVKFLSSSTAFHVMRGNVATALEQGAQLRQISLATKSVGLNIVAEGLCAVAHLYSGEIASAVAYAEDGLKRLTPEINQAIARKSGLAPEVNISCYLNEAWWALGYPDRAREYRERAVRAAREIEHRPSEEFAVGHSALSCHMERDPGGILEVAEQAREIAGKHRSPFWGPVTETYQGWAMCVMGSCDEGIELMRRGIDEYIAGGHGLSQVRMRVALAEGLGMAGVLDEALGELDETIRISEQTGEVFYVAEAYRLRGDYWRRSAEKMTGQAREEALVKAETSVLEALRQTRQQGAKSLELRAQMSLFLLRSVRGDLDAVVDALAASVASFPADIQSLDVTEAQALLTNPPRHQA